jgi:hypothetical protein
MSLDGFAMKPGSRVMHRNRLYAVNKQPAAKMKFV